MDTEQTAPTKPLWLTKEEALSMLEATVASMASFGETEERALLKLGEFCRAFLREETARPPANPEPPQRSRRVRYISSPMALRRRVYRSMPRAFTVTRA